MASTIAIQTFSSPLEEIVSPSCVNRNREFRTSLFLNYLVLFELYPLQGIKALLAVTYIFPLPFERDKMAIGAHRGSFLLLYKRASLTSTRLYVVFGETLAAQACLQIQIPKTSSGERKDRSALVQIIYLLNLSEDVRVWTY
jgi:hypothetical protein